MNYFAHGYRFTDDPYFLAGTALPDWLSVVDRRVRARSKGAAPLVDDPDPHLAAVARGVMQHHRDDDWFHRTRAFAELSWQLTVAIRDRLPADDGLRPSFLGHILVEILLDAVLIEQAPQRLTAYYQALAQLAPDEIEQAVGKIAARPAAGLRYFIPRFCAERFLWDYAQDDKLLFRLNQVMRRVRLPELPAELLAILPQARADVRRRQAELLAPAEATEAATPGNMHLRP